jgi:multicomponent Na+:H+ antiporter subunit G
MTPLMWIGDSLIAAGVAFMAVGLFGLLKFRSLYTRILISAKIDTVAFITIMTGAMIRTGFSLQTFKLFLILVFAVVTTPIVSHAIARSARDSGCPLPRPGTPEQPDAMNCSDASDETDQADEPAQPDETGRSGHG